MRVIGIVNVTPDSFSDGGVHFDRGTAVESALRMEQDGAAMIDVGGESTRPGSDAVSIEDELDRVVPVIEQIRRRSAIRISVDTRKAKVAEAALDAGANVINDVSALRHDPNMRALAARRGVDVILMHMRGEPKTMQQNPQYDDVVADVASELRQWRDEAVAAGVDPSKISVDPGIGFGKTLDHNLILLAQCDVFAKIAPVVIGASRKAFVGNLAGRAAGPDRVYGSLAAVAAAIRGGADSVRVHDVRATIDFIKVYTAIFEKEWR